MITAALAGGFWMWWQSPDRVLSDDPIPDPLEPFGLTRVADLVFRWTIPSDGSQVYVEILQASAEDGGLRRVWASESSRRGALRLPTSVTLTQGEHYWRPVAAPDQGPEQPGSVATFSVYP